MDEKTFIVDHKRTSRTPPSDYESRYAEQLTGYSLGYKARWGRMPEQVRLDVAVSMAKAPRKDTAARYKELVEVPGPTGGVVGITTIKSARTEEDLAWYLRVMESVAVNLQGCIEGKAEWQFAAPGSWWCSETWCEYWDYCHKRI